MGNSRGVAERDSQFDFYSARFAGVYVKVATTAGIAALDALARD